MKPSNRFVTDLLLDGETFQVELMRENVGYSVHVPTLPGCISQGYTLEDAMENAADAIKAWLRAQEELAREGVHVSDRL